jgi:uncharacterized protein (TIGR03435 family)
MKRAILGATLTACASWVAARPSDESPKFAAADVHVSVKTTGPMNQYVRTGPVRAGRYEIRKGTMVDLIHIAYEYDSDKILGGPNWLEMDRFDVAAKVPEESTAETHKQMLQALLQDRFRLVVHKDTKPLPTYVLVQGKKPLMKEANGSEQTGCRPSASAPAGAPGGRGFGRIMTMSPDGQQSAFTLGPGNTLAYNCRNISMEAFAANLRTMFGSNLGNNPIHDETGLKGNWNFDLTYSLQLFGPMGGDETAHISIFNAVEKQLGLKLEERQIPTPVIVVDSVERTPSPNPPGTADVLPPVVYPTEFEVASIKPVEPGAGRGGRYQMQPGGRLVADGMPLRFLIQQAFNTFNNEAIAGLPSFADSDRYNIIGKAPAVGGVPLTNMDMDAVAPMLLALLKDRFKLTYHTEDRPVSAYTLVASKPKLKKADPNSRSSCKNNNAPPPAPPGTRVLFCTNVTMDQFVERFQGMGPDFNWPVANQTGLEGGWTLTLTFNQRAMFNGAMAGGRGGRGGAAEANPEAGAMPTASDPNDALTIFEAVEKQLGLKLEKQKRPMPVIVIDHIEQKPTEN